MGAIMQFELGQKIIDTVRGKKKGKIKNSSTLVLLQSSVEKWFKDNGDSTLRLNYALKSDSIVFDVGGYKGDWTIEILAKYNCKIHIFEPVKEFYDFLETRFLHNGNIKINSFGLADNSESICINLDDNASSIYTNWNLIKEEIKLVNILEYIEQNNIENIDLIKINVEGGEYSLLEQLISSGFINNITNIQVQFHNLGKDCKKRMVNIQKNLEKTHKITYQYPWCWENWEKKEER